MRTARLFLAAGAALLFGLLYSHPAAAQANALAGQVSSAAEGAMEGVLVSAKRAGSNMTVTVVSDAQGRYQFPAARLEPGKYTLTIRAVGYDLAGPTTAAVGTQGAATADLKLVKAKDLAAQLTNAEWLHSAPGTPQQKRPLLGCVGLSFARAHHALQA